jgi:hypothetical protein
LPPRSLATMPTYFCQTDLGSLLTVCGDRPADGMQTVDEDGIDTRTGKPGCDECAERRGRIVFFMPEGKPDTWPESPNWDRSEDDGPEAA